MKFIVRIFLLVIPFALLFVPSLVRFFIGIETCISALKDSDNQVRCAAIDGLGKPGSSDQKRVVKALLMHASEVGRTSMSTEDLSEPARTILKIKGRWFGGKEVQSTWAALNGVLRMGHSGREKVQDLVSDSEVGSYSREITETWDELEKHGVPSRRAAREQPDIGTASIPQGESR